MIDLAWRGHELSGRSLAHRSGTTLFELIIALVILAILSSVAALAPRLAAARPELDNRAIIANARAVALTSGHSVSITLESTDQATIVTAFPDGTVIADATLGIDRLTGRQRPRQHLVETHATK